MQWPTCRPEYVFSISMHSTVFIYLRVDISLTLCSVRTMAAIQWIRPKNTMNIPSGLRTGSSLKRT